LGSVKVKATRLRSNSATGWRDKVENGRWRLGKWGKEMRHQDTTEKRHTSWGWILKSSCVISIGLLISFWHGCMWVTKIIQMVRNSQILWEREERERDRDKWNEYSTDPYRSETGSWLRTHKHFPTDPVGQLKLVTPPLRLVVFFNDRQFQDKRK
jgi:hypothetical protein